MHPAARIAHAQHARLVPGLLNKHNTVANSPPTPTPLPRRPGGLLFEFAGGAEAAAELRELLRRPEELVQHPGHMQKLIGMVDAAKKLISAAHEGDGTPGDGAPDAAAAAAAAAPAVPPTAAVPPVAALPLLKPGASAFHPVPPVVAPPAAKPRKSGSRKRKGGLGAASWRLNELLCVAH